MLDQRLEALEMQIAAEGVQSSSARNAQFVLAKSENLYRCCPEAFDVLQLLPFPTIDLDAVALDIRRKVLAEFFGEGSQQPNHIAGPNNKRVVQAVAIAHYSGLLNHDGLVVVDDLCGGSGLVSAVSANLRGGVGETISRCVEWNGSLRGKHSLMGEAFGVHDEREFLEQDIRRYPFRRISDDPYYCVAKHACGSLTDRIIQGVTSQGVGYGPDHTLVMPCCYGHIKAGEHFNSRLNGVIERDDWFRLAGLAQASGNPNVLVNLTARVAMALIDCLRCLALPDRFQPVVTEIVPPEVTPLNQAIILFDREAKY